MIKRIIAIIFITLFASSCLDQQGVNVTQTCAEADTCKDAIVDPTAAYCVKNRLADRYDELDGNGTVGNPFIICNPAQIVDMSQRSSSLSKSFRLAQDIDLAQYYIDGGDHFQIASCGQTTCVDFGPGHIQYNGTFDGAGYSILNFEYTIETSEAGASLFGSIGSSGVIANLNMVAPTIRGNHAMAALAGRNDGIIQNVKVNDGLVQIFGANDNVENIGGVVGLNRGVMRFVEVNKASAMINIVGKETTNIGGIVGLNAKDAFIGDAKNNSPILHDTAGVIGGIAGINKGTITKSKNLTDITFRDGNVGGIAGEMHHFATVSRSYNVGDIQGIGTVDNVGGLVGIINFPQYGDINASEDESRGLIINSYNKGDVIADVNSTDIGGIVGHNLGAVQSSYNTGDVNGGDNVGGIVGLNDYIIAQCFVHGIRVIGGTSRGIIFGDTSAVAADNEPSDTEKGNGIDPAPIWSSVGVDLDTAESPFNTYSGMNLGTDCIGCNSDGVVQGNGVGDFFDLSFELFSESYTVSCPSPLPPNTDCTPTTQKVIHWDFSSVWSRKFNTTPELGFED